MKSILPEISFTRELKIDACGYFNLVAGTCLAWKGFTRQSKGNVRVTYAYACSYKIQKNLNSWDQLKRLNVFFFIKMANSHGITFPRDLLQELVARTCPHVRADI